MRAMRPKSSLLITTVGITLLTSKVGLLKARIWRNSRPASLILTSAPFSFRNASSCSLIWRLVNGFGALGSGVGVGDGVGKGRGFGPKRCWAWSSVSRFAGGFKLTGIDAGFPIKTILPRTLAL